MRFSLYGLVKFAIGCLLTLAISLPAVAGLYKCVDRHNKTFYQDMPCQEMTSEKLPYTLAKSPSEGDERAFFWKATNGKGVLYLLGSLHFGAQSLYPLPQMVNNAFNNSDVLVVEADINNLSSKEMAGGLPGKGRYADKSKLEDHIKRITWNKTLELANKLELNDELLASAKPWLAALMLNAQSLKREGYNAEQGIDNFFTQQASNKKPVMELESEQDQINLFDQLSDLEQEQLLLHTLKELNHGPEYHKGVFEAWKKGDVEAMDLIVRQSFDTGQLSSKLFNIFFLERNERMANRLIDLSNDGRTYFVVVGSGHLSGEKGILKLLEQKGFAITQP